MTRPTRDVKRADAAHQPAMIATLSLAFQDDPAISWLMPDPDQRRQRLPRMFSVFTPLDMAAGMALRSDADEVATLWRAPGFAHTPMRQMIMKAIPLLTTFGTSLPRALALGEAIDAHHPAEGQYWYLHYAAVRPDHQGKGWGGAAIRAGIARADADNVPVFLETATPANVGLYQALGFTILSEWDAPKGGPHFWSMLRPISASA